MISQRSKCHILRTQGLKDTVICIGCFASWFPEVRIYKRKQESKKTGKHAFDQESDQEKKKTHSRPRKRSKNDNGQEKKKENFLFFLIVLLVRFLVKSMCFLSFFSYFLVFIYKFSSQFNQFRFYPIFTLKIIEIKAKKVSSVL